ncbi:MAG: hypothetical protein RL026_779 [Pseudomonadota bacterium]
MAGRTDRAQSARVDPLTPKLLSTLRGNYSARDLRADAFAGLTVAVVALPLSLAIAIASGVGPERGLYAAVVGGFLISLLGGSRFQIGGPAGAFIVLVSATVAAHGVDGLMVVTFLAGALMLVAGWLRLGRFIRHVPAPVTLGFTAGIALIILTSQIKEFFGLTLAGPEPGPLWPRLQALAAGLPSASIAAAALAVLTLGIIVGLRRWRPRWPNLLLALIVATALTAVADLPVATVGGRYGALPSGLPLPSWPDLSWARIVELAPLSLSFALLGGIEGLLSAVVADGLGGGRHRPDAELVAQGAANMATALFGGLVVTGTIARTATNVRAGARSPMAGMLHAALVLVFLWIAAPLMAAIPLAALAGLLVTVAWNMAERHAVLQALRGPRDAALVLAATFLLTVLDDLTTGIVGGIVLSTALRWRGGRSRQGM